MKMIDFIKSEGLYEKWCTLQSEEHRKKVLDYYYRHKDKQKEYATTHYDKVKRSEYNRKYFKENYIPAKKKEIKWTKEYRREYDKQRRQQKKGFDK